MRSNLIIRLAVAAAALVAGAALAAPPTDANGANPRPFYIVAHNPNTTADVDDALAAGANALEPDITKAYFLGIEDTYPDTLEYLVDWDSSTPYRAGTLSDTPFSGWLAHVHDVAAANPNKIALILFDTKPSAAKTDLGPVILDAVRNILNTNGVNIPFVISVGTTNDGAVYDDILTTLGPTEGVQVDGQNDPAGVLLYFSGRGYLRNVTIGDGGADAELPLVPTSYWTDMDSAAYLRAKTGNPKSLPYLYIFDNALDQNKIVDGGEDGIIPDVFTVPGADAPPFHPEYITALYQAIQNRQDIRLATALDNPFQPRDEAYTLEVVTGTDSGAGTDAVLTFTLIGANGSSSILVDTSKSGRMESGNVNQVTIPSKDLGQLQWVQVSNDGSGTGPDWEAYSITVFSARWLSPVSGGFFYTANSSVTSTVLNDWVGSGQTSGFRLVAQGSQSYYSNAWAFASSAALPPDGSQTHPWPELYSGYNFMRTNGTLHLGGGLYNELGRLDKPCRIVYEPSYNTSASARLTAP